MVLVMKMNKVLIGKEIPVAVLRNNYINGVDKYNYEKFMVDFINNSKMVDEKEGASFYHQEEQSNSEADASNGFYDIDFKILCEPEQMHARTATGIRIFKTQEGNTNKNIMVLLPFEYYFDGCQTDEDTAKEIINKLNVPFNVMREYRITQTLCDLYFIFKSKSHMVIVDANKDVCFYDMVPYNCSGLFEYLFKTGHFWPVIDE